MTVINYPAPPTTYVCGKCGKAGVRLWREWNSAPKLYCWACALRRVAPPYYGDDHKATQTLNPNRVRGTIEGVSGGILCCARWTDDGAYWGYTSGPDESVKAWFALPVEVPA